MFFTMAGGGKVGVGRGCECGCQTQHVVLDQPVARAPRQGKGGCERLSLTHTHTHKLTHSHTHIHTHSLSLFLSLFFFFITLKPRVEWYTKSMRLKYEPASEPLNIYVN